MALTCVTFLGGWGVYGLKLLCNVGFHKYHTGVGWRMINVYLILTIGYDIAREFKIFWKGHRRCRILPSLQIILKSLYRTAVFAKLFQLHSAFVIAGEMAMGRWSFVTHIYLHMHKTSYIKSINQNNLYSQSRAVNHPSMIETWDRKTKTFYNEVSHNYV